MLRTPLRLLAVLLVSALLAACTPSAKRKSEGSASGGLANAHHMAREATAMLERGEWDAAVTKATVAVALRPESAELHLLLGMAHHLAYRDGQQGAAELAEAGYKVALNLDPSLYSAAKQLGALYLDQQRYQAAQAAFARAIHLDGTRGEAYRLMAVASYHARQIDTALWAIRRSLAERADAPESLRVAAIIHTAAGFTDLAADNLLRYESGKPDARELARVREVIQRWRTRRGDLMKTALSVAQATSPTAGAVPPANPGVPGATDNAANEPSPNTPGQWSNDNLPPLPRPSPAPATPVGAAPATAHAPAKAAMADTPVARDWRDCRQRFSNHDYRDDGASMGGSAGGQTSFMSMPMDGGSGGSNADEGVMLAPLPSPCNGLPSPRMVLIDVTMLTTSGDETHSRGVNLLDTLAIVFKGERDGNNSFAGDGTSSKARTITYSAGLPAEGITYSLNIANATRARSEVLAKPTIVALDRKPSSFFSGAVVTVPVQGTFSSGLEDKQIGVSLSITPTVVDDYTVLLAARATRSFLEPPREGTIDQSMVTSRNFVNANVKLAYGQTLVLSGLRELEDTTSNSGVPVLKDVPLVQYAFSRRTDTRLSKNILILITPRKVESSEEFLQGAARAKNKDQPDEIFRVDLDRIGRQVSDLGLPSNVATVLESLRSSVHYAEFRRGDLGQDRDVPQARGRQFVEDLKLLAYF